MPNKGPVLEPPLHVFQWPDSSVSQLGKPLLKNLVPPPPAPPLPHNHGVYPQAPTYQLAVTNSYRRGCIYTAPFDTGQRLAESNNMLQIQVPPNVTPTQFDLQTRSFISDPIPGMVRVPLGIPMVHQVDGDPKRSVTAVCAHSLDSLMQYPEGEQVKALIPRLMELTFGIEESETNAGVPGIFELEGMHHNLRSKKSGKPLQPGDGSFNLASTRGEGEGPGIFMPAVQTNTPQAASVIQEVLQILHRLYRYITPLCVSCFEWHMLEFNGHQNNVVAFGGLEPGPTSCQLNSSRAANIVSLDLTNPPADASTLLDLKSMIYGTLSDSIGPQGANHNDPNDDALAVTFFVEIFRVAPGSDLGPFIWNRGGLYLREIGVYVLFSIFRGQDVHSGYPPTILQEMQDAWSKSDEAKQLFKKFGAQVRAAYVCYPSQAATTHSTQLLYTPSLGFLHSPAPDRKKDPSRRYFATHGHIVLGDLRARANRLGLEGIYALKNYLNLCSLKLNVNINVLLENITFVDESGNTHALEPSQFDIDSDEAYETICIYRGYYSWYRELVAAYSLGLRKSQFKDVQKAIRQARAGQIEHPKALATAHDLLPAFREEPTGYTPIKFIDKVLERTRRGAEVYPFISISYLV